MPRTAIDCNPAIRPPRSAPTGARPRAIARVLSIAPFTRLMMSSTSVRAVDFSLRRCAPTPRSLPAQPRPQPVREVRPDPQLLASGDLEDRALEAAAFGDVGDDREPVRGA